HLGAAALRAPPASGMRIASEAPDLVAADAVRCRTLIVTACAEQDIAPRFAAVEAPRSRVRPHPAGRMRVPPTGAAIAHAPLDVAPVARLWRVTMSAARWLLLRLNRVAHHEIAAVYERRVDAFGAPSFHGEILRGVVASVAARLRVTGLAKL